MDDFAEEESCDFDLLPALSEDEENVSLADVLSLQDSCLTEQAIWAICLECTLSLKNIVQSAIFQTLCITPDTLAFNTNGNVCFMEQISDDPEGAFVPPEIDETGNTFEAHLYSLGATLTAALEYTMETEADLEFSQDLYALLGQMQKENPKERPYVEVVISLCKEKLKFSSPSDICQALSAAGRKMLSIESCGTFQGHNTSLTRTQCQLQPGCNESAMLEGKLIQCDHPESKSASLPHNNFGELYLSPDTSSVYPNHMTSSNDKEAVDILPYCYAVSETSGQNNPSDATDETNPGCNALENYCVREFCNEVPLKSGQNCLFYINKMSPTFMTFKEECNLSMLRSPDEKHTERKDCWTEDRQYEGGDSEIGNNEVAKTNPSFKNHFN